MVNFTAFRSLKIVLYPPSATMEVAAIKCGECDKSFKKKDNLQSHVSAVHRICLSQCEECGKEFKNPAYLRNHMNRFHHNEIAVCDVCKKVCKNKANLYNHKKDVHERVANLLCILCGEEQKNYSYLSRHKRRFCKYKVEKVQSMSPAPKDNQISPVLENFIEMFECSIPNASNESDSSIEITNEYESGDRESLVDLKESEDDLSYISEGVLIVI